MKKKIKERKTCRCFTCDKKVHFSKEDIHTQSQPDMLNKVSQSKISNYIECPYCHRYIILAVQYADEQSAPKLAE